MPLSAGYRLGRYEVLKSLGAGGMGEVYRARDTRLDRDVAIKILPESVARDPERLARFEREAKAVAALSHPNILALHDAGTEGGTAFAVTELLEGETLRERLSQGPLPVRKAIDTAIQIARGLTAAHAKGVVHRDLKPENVFLVADGQVKILDFGLARTSDPADSAATTTQLAEVAVTDPGTVLGTVGYMAPEQVRGQTIDARADLFALGAVLYEMVAGDRAFRRDTAAETMTAILREDVPNLPPQPSAQVPALDRIIRHCLEKTPIERFQSARDVVFALEALSGATGTASEPARPASSTRRTTVLAAALVLLAVAAIAAWATGYLQLGRPAAGAADLAYQRVTFDEGFVFAGRFERDGRKIVYSADWENQRRDVFSTSLDNPTARALGPEDADLLAVGADGALAILVKSTIFPNPYHRVGTVARASLTGGAPREGRDRVSFADFAPDGTLAVLRGSELEWPQGQTIVKAQEGSLRSPRVSPAGTQIAFFRCLAGNCRVTIADRSGKTLAESQWYSDWWGLAWAPGGKEVWFSAVPGKSGEQCSVYAIDVTGRERLLFRAPGSLTLHDVSAEGRILASFDQVTNRLEMRDSPTAPPRDLSWKEGGTLADVSPDGVVLFYETGDSGGPDGLVYVRRPADPEPLPIGPGVPIAISDDGQTVLARTSRLPYKLSLVPTSGLPQALDVGDAIDASGGGWLKDGRLVVQLVRKAGEHPVVYARPREGGPLTQLLSDGVGVPPVRPVAPDGRRLVAFDVSRGPVMCEAAATGLATCKPLTAVTKDSIRPDERFGGWTADGGGVIVYRAYPTPVSIDRLDLATGRRERVAMLQPALPALTGIRQLLVTPKGAIFYDYSRNRSVLYVISGVK